MTSNSENNMGKLRFSEYKFQLLIIFYISVHLSPLPSILQTTALQSLKYDKYPESHST